MGGVLADQWREFLYCDSLGADTLVARGRKRALSCDSNVSGNQNAIIDGSIIAVNDGQCMLIVDEGTVVEVSAEPGEFVFDASSEPSILCGLLGLGLKETFTQMGERFTLEDDNDKRVYFFNTKEMQRNKCGTASPILFCASGDGDGQNTNVAVRCNGEFSYRICDPLLFYKNVSGDVEENYMRDRIDGQLKSELLAVLQPAFAKLLERGVCYSAMPDHTEDLVEILNEQLFETWLNLRGIEMTAISVNSISAVADSDMTATRL